MGELKVDVNEYLLNFCPLALSVLLEHKERTGAPVTDHDLESLMQRMLKKGDMYTVMESGVRPL